MNSSHSRLNNHRGMSLVEVLVSIGILSILSVAFTAMTTSMIRSNAVMSGQTGFAALQTDLRVQLQRKASCLKSIQPVPSSWTKEVPITVSLGKTEIKANADLTDYNLMVDQLSLTNYQAMGTSAGGNNLYAADLVMSGSSRKLSSAKKGSEDDRFAMNRKVAGRLIFETDAGGTAVSCFGVDPDMDIQTITKIFCDSTGGTYDSKANKCKPTVDESVGSNGPNCLNSGSLAGRSNTTCTQVLAKPIPFNEFDPKEKKGNYGWYCPKKPIIVDLDDLDSSCTAYTKGNLDYPGGAFMPSGMTCKRHNPQDGSNTTVQCAAGIMITTTEAGQAQTFNPALTNNASGGSSVANPGGVNIR